MRCEQLPAECGLGRLAELVVSIEDGEVLDVTLIQERIYGPRPASSIDVDAKQPTELGFFDVCGDDRRYDRHLSFGRIQKLVQGQKQVEEALLSAQKRSASITDKDLAPVAAAALKEREAWARTYQAVLEQAEDILGLLGHREQAWRLRYGLINEEIHHEKLTSRKDEIENHIKNLSRMLNLQQSFQTNLQSQITAVENRISELSNRSSGD